MYFWKIKNLKEDIKTKQLTEKDRFIYMFISLILTCVMLEMFILLPSEGSNMWDVMSSLLNILIVSLGTFFAFKANGGATGVDFLGKYFSISFVISLRFIPLFILIVIVYSYLTIEEIETNVLLDMLAYSIWQMAMYWRIIKHIRDVKEI